MSSKSRSREVAFVASMGALGNVLAFVTIAPTIIQQVALDFSAIPVLIAAAFGGVWVGISTGFIAGLLPSVFFGFIGGSLGFLGFSTCIGKAIHGFAVGLLTNYLKPLQRKRGTLLFIPIVLIGFIPESIWIALVFSIFVPLFIPSMSFLSAILTTILIKAWFEVAVMAFFMSALSGHEGFKATISSYFIRRTR